MFPEGSRVRVRVRIRVSVRVRVHGRVNPSSRGINIVDVPLSGACHVL